MTKKEALRLCEIHKYSNIVPRINNNMDIAGYVSHYYDSNEVAGYIYHLIEEMLNLNIATYKEERQEFEENFNKWLTELKEFVEFRTKEQWEAHSRYQYQFNLQSFYKL